MIAMIGYILMNLLAMVPCQVVVGPMDGFRANQTAIHARVDFVTKRGTIAGSRLDRASIWAGKEIPVEVEPRTTILGRWETDGSVQHIVNRPLEEVWRARKEPRDAGKTAPNEVLGFEVLYDVGSSAFHYFPMWPGNHEGFEITYFPGADRFPLSAGQAPMFFTDLIPLDRGVERMFPGVRPRRFAAERGGRPVEIEVYKKPMPDDGWVELQIAYDPKSGFLPRYLRFISLFQGKALTKETFLTDVRRCEGGGFVPGEWIQLFYGIDNFDAQFPGETDELILPLPRTVSVIHYRTTGITEMKSTPKLDQEMDRVRAFVGEGGAVRLNSRVKEVGLDQVKSSLGARVKEPRKAAAPPRVDEAELTRYPEVVPPATRRSWGLPVVGAGAVALGAVVFWRRRGGK
ncbi:hypothetical protein TA3x_005434 [Tundrisphaera sp. TA3]|uniref:hypothetical protein n=1 Tax=Tundrisphaera sp. TA3 TaxID=3435775 RepID=UPI003EBB4A3D